MLMRKRQDIARKWMRSVAVVYGEVGMNEIVSQRDFALWQSGDLRKTGMLDVSIE